MPGSPEFTPDWLRIFAGGSFGFHMRLSPGNAARFFAASEDPALLEERARLMEEAPEHCFGMDGEAMPLFIEAAAMIAGATGSEVVRDPFAAASAWEPDWVLLSASGGSFRVAGGAVCFPSGWSLPEKMGLPLAAVHGPVPRLNETLGPPIDSFLARIAPGAAYERDNWGLTAVPVLDQHPRRAVPRLLTDASPDMTWIRLERQFLARLSPGGGILFGIRVTHYRLGCVVRETPGLAPRIALALETMPGDIAAYKGIADARASLAARLRAAAAQA